MTGNKWVFLGPTISAAIAREIAPDCALLPPVAGGDLLRLPIASGDLVAIIDGFFYQCPAVRHKEILSLLDRGVEVIGAASMGALRAVELAAYGMRGYGSVYNAYASGEIEGDDEVAVLHAPAEQEYAALSEALVNLRHNCRLACRSGSLSPDTAARVVRAAASLPFYQRTRARIFQRAAESGVEEEEIARFQAFFSHSGRDLKAEDARMLLRVVGDWRPRDPAAQGKSFSFQETSYFHGWREEEAGRPVEGGGFVSDREVLTFCQLFASDYVDFHYRSALENLAADYSNELGLVIEERLALLTAFRRREGLASEESLANWLDARCLSRGELEAHLTEEACVRALCRRAGWGGADGEPDEVALEKLVAEYGVFRRIFGSSDRAPAWVREWLTPQEDSQLEDRQKLARLAVRTFCSSRWVPWRTPLIRRLKVGGPFRMALQRVASARMVHQVLQPSLPPRTIERAAPLGLVLRFRERWGLREDGDPELALLDRGFASQDEFAARARPYCLYDQLMGSGAAFSVCTADGHERL